MNLEIQTILAGFNYTPWERVVLSGVLFLLPMAAITLIAALITKRKILFKVTSVLVLLWAISMLAL